VSRIDPATGRVEYQQNCKYRNVPFGYLVTAPAPTGLRGATKNRVELYGVISSVDGDRVKLTNTVFVRVLPPGQTVSTVRPIVYMGVPVGP
jgi:hypothetical protein